MSTVITNASQTETFDYDFGAGALVEIQPDGSAIVISETSAATDTEDAVDTIIAVANAPWAVDATGADVQTHCEANGSVLTQVVTHQRTGVTYPVAADPTFDNPNIIQYRVRFNRAETASIAAGGWGGVVGSFSCGCNGSRACPRDRYAGVPGWGRSELQAEEVRPGDSNATDRHPRHVLVG